MTSPIQQISQMLHTAKQHGLLQAEVKEEQTGFPNGTKVICTGTGETGKVVEQRAHSYGVKLDKDLSRVVYFPKQFVKLIEEPDEK